MYEHERPAFGYACAWTNPNRNRTSVFDVIKLAILFHGRKHLYPYMPDADRIFGEDLSQAEIARFTQEAKGELGDSSDIVHIAVDILDSRGRLNLGIFTPDETSALRISETNGISQVQYTATVFQDDDGQFKPTTNPLGALSSLIG